MAESTALHKRGTVFLYLSNKNPLRSDLLNHLLLWRLQWIFLTLLSLFLRLLPRNFLMFPTKVSCNIYIVLQLYAYFIQQKEYVVLVHDVIWTLLGLYEVITSVDRDEEITWHTQNNKPVLHVLLVCLNLFFTQLMKSNQTVEKFCFVKHPIQHYHFCEC